MRGSHTFVLLDSTGLGGTTFDSVEDSLPSASVSLIYGLDTVTISIIAPTFTDLGLTRNEKAVGGALDFLSDNALDTSLINYLDTLPNASLPALYNEMSPASLTSIFQMGFSMAGVQAGMVGLRLSQELGDLGFSSDDISWKDHEGPLFAGNLSASREAFITKSVQPDRWSGFVNGLGDFASVTGDGNAAGYQFSTGGALAGADYRFLEEPDRRGVFGLQPIRQQPGRGPCDGHRGPVWGLRRVEAGRAPLRRLIGSGFEQLCHRARWARRNGDRQHPGTSGFRGAWRGL